jgi:tRNA1Val (adenine37-N6)-methyltransferase
MITDDFSGAKNSSAPLDSFVQSLNGYRFSQDSVALAKFIWIQPHETLLDLCAGSAVVPVLLWRRCPFSCGLAVEFQAELVDQAHENLRLAQISDRVEVMLGDICHIESSHFDRFFNKAFAQGFDVVSANPPFHKRGGGRLNPNSQKAIARHELYITLPQLIHCACRCLKPGGRFYLIHRADRRAEILAALKKHRMTMVREESPNDGRCRVDLILMEAKKPSSSVQGNTTPASRLD